MIINFNLLNLIGLFITATSVIFAFKQFINILNLQKQTRETELRILELLIDQKKLEQELEQELEKNPKGSNSNSSSNLNKSTELSSSNDSIDTIDPVNNESSWEFFTFIDTILSFLSSFFN